MAVTESVRFHKKRTSQESGYHSVFLCLSVGSLPSAGQSRSFRGFTFSYSTVILLLYTFSFWPQQLTEAMVTPQQLGNEEDGFAEKPNFIGPAQFYLQLVPQSHARVFNMEHQNNKLPRPKWSKMEQELEDMARNELVETDAYDGLPFYMNPVNPYERVRKVSVDTAGIAELDRPHSDGLNDIETLEERKPHESDGEVETLLQNTKIDDPNIVGSEPLSTVTGCQDYGDPFCSSSVNLPTATYSPLTKQTSEKLVEKYVIEKVKDRILSQIKQPNLAYSGVSPTSNRSAWDALPMVIQKHLKTRVDNANKQIDNPAVEGEERETFLVVYPDRYRLRNYPSISFFVKIIDDIQSDSIEKAIIHFEHSNELPPGAILELLEIIPLVNFSFSSNGGSSTDGSADSPAYGLSRKEKFKVTQPRMATKSVSHAVGTLSLDVTSRLISWLKNRKTMKYTGPMIRHILLVCQECQPSVQLVDPKKVVLEIGYHRGLKRHRRSLTGRDSGLTNLCQDNGHRFSCCTQPLSIKFTEIGLKDWIIHPQIFEPNYCRGSCQADGGQPTVNRKSYHNVIMNIIHQNNVSQLATVGPEVLQSCCHPTRRTSMTVVYQDSNKELKMHTWHNLIVLGCGCS